MQVNIDKVEYEIVARRKTVKPNLQNIYKTEPRPQTKELDIFPYTDRTLIDYNKYHQYIGHAVLNIRWQFRLLVDVHINASIAIFIKPRKP